MLTRCPTCQTTFRVTAEQLMARQGRVRCGQCLGVFNALGTLIEQPASAAPSTESIVIDGFDVPPIAKPLETPPLGAGEPAPVEPVVSATAVVEPFGEEVAEPVVEYVDIGELPADADDAPMDAAVSGDEAFEDELTRTEINIEEVREPEILDRGEVESVAAREPSPDDEFTKTVVGFTWYVEPEPVPASADQPVADEFAGTVIEPRRAAAPEMVPKPAHLPGGGAHADLALEPFVLVEPEPLPPADDDYTKTVLESVKLTELEAEPIGQAPEDEFTETMVEPRPVMPKSLAELPPLQLVPQTPIAPPADAAPARAEEAADQDFTKTVVISSRIAESAIDDEFADLEFDLAPIDDIQVEEIAETPSILERQIQPAISFPTLEPLPEPDEASYAPANTILQGLAATTGPVAKPSRSRAVEPETMREPGTEDLPGPPTQPGATPESAPSDEPVLKREPELEAEPASELDSILELQELPEPRRWPWVLGSLVAVCLLAAQAIVHFRVDLSVLMPRTKPALMAVCEMLDCKLPLPSQIDLIGIETSDLSPGPEGAGHLQLAATLRNRASFVQTWPDLELTLTDGADKALVRRVVAPGEYLPPARKAADGFPPRSEQTVYLDLKAPGVPAVGYRLYVFYP